MCFFLSRILNAEEKMEISDLEYTSWMFTVGLIMIINDKAFTTNSELPRLFNKSL